MTTDTTQQTEAVIRHHSQAGREMEAILSDYTDDSVIFTPNGPFRGLAAIRTFFEALHKFFDAFPPDVPVTYKRIRRDVEGEYAYQVFSLEPLVLLATDTFVVRGGKIIMQTVAAHLAPEAPVLDYQPPTGAADG